MEYFLTITDLLTTHFQMPIVSKPTTIKPSVCQVNTNNELFHCCSTKEDCSRNIFQISSLSTVGDEDEGR